MALLPNRLCKAWGVVLLLLLESNPASSWAQEGKTAEELYNSALVSFNAGKFVDAEAAFSEFLTSYGESGQIDELLPRLLPLLAISQIRLEKFDTASETIDRALEVRPPITPQAAEELQFWRGVCHLKADEFDLARARFESFAKEYPRSDKRIEALILAGTAFLMEEKWADATAYLKPLEETLAFPDKGRIIVLRFYSLLQAGRWDEAMQLVNETFPHLDKMIQVSAMQVLALELGNTLLEQERYREAIGCFQRIWNRSRVLGLQQERLEGLRARKVAAERRNDPFEQFRTSQLLAKVERELKTFREIESFDPAVRLRLATAYLELDRYREAAIVLEGMLTDLPADPIVEGASLTLLKCWAEVQRWPRVVENADRFLAKFRRSPQVPVVLFLRGQAEQEQGEFTKAIATFDAIVTKHAESELAPRALFMMGYTELLNEDYPAAAKTFQMVSDRHEKEDISEAAVYWKGMALSMDKQNEAAREQMDRYLAQFKNGSFRTAALFRKAYSAHAERRYDISIPELRAFLRAHPGAAEVDEALILLGDALMAEGDIDEGIATLKRVSQQNIRFYEEAWFKVGRALKLLEDYSGMRAHFEQFIRMRPESSRVPEAVFQIGWTWRQEEQPDEARRVYEETINAMADDPNRIAVEDLLLGLIRLARSPEERADLRADLIQRLQRAEADQRPVLQSRLAWALGHAFRRDDPERAQLYFEEAGQHAQPSTSNPLLLADVASAHLAAGRRDKAAAFYADLIKWNPRAPQKDQALAALGTIAKEEGRIEDALRFFARFQREVPGSLHAPKVLAAKAEIERMQGRSDEAIVTLESLLEAEGASGREKAEALYQIGSIWLERGNPRRAFPYFQRIYVLYSRFHDLVAKSYVQCGSILESLQDSQGAIETYRELLEREELLELEESKIARERLRVLES